MSIYCKECDKSFKSSLSLSRHISQVHFKCEEYYIKYISPAKKCNICSNNVMFLGIATGYKKTCSQRCAAILRRKERKELYPEKELEFRRKLSESIKKDWANNDYKERLNKMMRSHTTYMPKSLIKPWNEDSYKCMCLVFNIEYKREDFESISTTI